MSDFGLAAALIVGTGVFVVGGVRAYFQERARMLEGGGSVTLEQAQAELAGLGMRLQEVPMSWTVRMDRPRPYVVFDASGDVVARGATWQEAYARVTNRSPF